MGLCWRAHMVVPILASETRRRNVSTMQDDDGFPSGLNPDCDFLLRSADEAARLLLGCVLIRDMQGSRVRVRIVETEAYDQDDPASHAFGGPSERNRALFGPAGHAYVYVSYGMHHCCNITAGSNGFGAGALIRAVEPLRGFEMMQSRRGKTGIEVCNGPGKLCQALDIDRRLYGHRLDEGPLMLERGRLRKGERIQRTPRVGISRARGCLRRFIIADNPYVSKVPKAIREQALWDDETGGMA